MIYVEQGAYLGLLIFETVMAWQALAQVLSNVSHVLRNVAQGCAVTFRITILVRKIRARVALPAVD